jgi:hypothetical protein
MNDPERKGAYQPESPEAKAVDAVAVPPHVGRYWVEKILGLGGFGLVCLAHDNY